MYDAARSRGATGWSLRWRAGDGIGQQAEQKVNEVAVLSAVEAQHRLRVVMTLPIAFGDDVDFLGWVVTVCRALANGDGQSASAQLLKDDVF